MFSSGTSPEAVAAFAARVGSLHPSGFRAMARASAEDLRDALPHVEVPTLLVYGDNDVRAPLPVAEDLHDAIKGSKLAVIPGVGHLCNVEAPERFNALVRGFLRDPTSRSAAP
jgi:pimeloyl-ACP methyl ester carboxylesterase